ncbi:hypothetical protein GCM10010182_67440 [Actinomadura cremea]|nr:hypothetical protein GCM10010182_67440 [Actinomadura cremea]
MDETPVNGCRHCGIPLWPMHAQRWTDGVGWHGWTEPTQAQIKARMLARRAARITKEAT